MLPPGEVETSPSVLLIDRSAEATKSVVSVALSFPGFGSGIVELIDAVFDSIPLASVSMSQGAV